MNAPQIESNKPVIGFTTGDLNGIGLELIIKVMADQKILEYCTPVIFASNKSINFYRKNSPEINFSYQNVKEIVRTNQRQISVLNVWEEEVAITPGVSNELGGKYAVKSMAAAVAALKEGKLHGLVTGPINKKNIQSPEFSFSGHTPYLKQMFAVREVLMLMTAANMRIGLVTEHVPVTDLGKFVSKELILSKLTLLNKSLMRDFGIDKPKIAVLGLNPHAGDEGLIGQEEETMIRPAIKEFKQHNNAIVFGPYSADAFFARGQYQKFDAVLAMYHDQGLIPFKSLAIGEGVNFTAGLPIVRTSPDHGTAFDIAGKNRADESSTVAAVFTCIDIIRQRINFDDAHKNPLRKVSNDLLRNVEDESIDENSRR